MAISHDALDGVPTGVLIGGDWSSSGSAGVIEVHDPATEEVIAEVAAGGLQEAAAAADAAGSALAAWSATAPRERGEVLRRAFELMTAEADRIGELVVLENGKALPDAKGEVAYAAEFFRWFSEEAVRNRGMVMTAPSGANRILLLHQPVGVAVMVTPWNFPAAMATRKIGPALAAGCTAILKPASATPLTALYIGELLRRAGVPDGVVNVLPARSSGEVVGHLLGDPRVRKLSFTGSTEVGRTLLAQAAENIVNCSMELGGNAPFIVMDDADLDAAVEGAMIAKMRNAGEACTAANRIYAHESVADELASRLSQAMSAMPIGHGLQDDVKVGPLIDEVSRETVEALVADAVDHGASVLSGGGRPDRKGWFLEPTVLVDVPPQAKLLREEIFGPVAPIVRFATDDEVIAAANDTEYGLVSYLYTKDLARGLRVSEALEAGMIGLNRGLVSDPAAPFGGVKQSGIGREGGHEGLLEYLEPKYIATSW